MTNHTAERSFDCVQWTRKVRDQMYEETKHLSRKQWLDRLKSHRPKDPVLARMWDSAKPPPSSRPAAANATMLLTGDG